MSASKSRLPVRQAPRPPILAPAKGGWTTQPGAQGLPAEPQSLAHGGDAGKPIYPIADCGLGTCTVGVAENSPAKGPARNERPKRRRQEHCGRHVCSHDAGTGQSAIRNPQSAIIFGRIGGGSLRLIGGFSRAGRRGNSRNSTQFSIPLIRCRIDFTEFEGMVPSERFAKGFLPGRAGA